MSEPEYHSKYSMSKLIMCLCPASLTFNENLEDTGEETEYQREGTLLHKVTGDVFESTDVIWDRATKELSLEQKGAVKYCLDYVRDSIVDKYRFSNWEIVSWWVEKRVHLGIVGLPDSSGTADLCILAQRKGTEIYHLHVVEWKFGSGVPVYAENNYQLRGYGLGGALKYVPATCSEVTVYTHVVQPRLDSVSTEALSLPELFRWAESVRLKLSLVDPENRIFSPGKKQCQWCRVKTTCKARKKFKDQEAIKVFDFHKQIEGDKDLLSNDELAELLDVCSDLKSYASEVEAYIYKALMKGEAVKGLKLVEGRANRAWRDEATAREYCLSAGMTDEDLYTKKFVSLNQVERFLGSKHKKAEEFKALWTKNPGKPSLAREDDPRPALSLGPESAFKDFIESE